jgi:two-component system CheB/CheR fusion protein
VQTRQALSKSNELDRLARSGAVVEVSIISTALVNESGKMYAIAITERAVGAGAA